MRTYNFNQRQIMKIRAPRPYSYFQLIPSEQKKVQKGIVPKTVTKATLYGRGSVRLKESSSGSTAGSPSMVIAISNAASNGSKE